MSSEIKTQSLKIDDISIGVTGIQGATGLRGETGITGAGITGIQGATGVGIQGATGVGGGGSAKSSQSLWLHTYNGYGSSATKILRWANIQEDVQEGATALFTYADSATNGMSLTMLVKAKVTATYTMTANADGNYFIGWSLNQTTLTDDIFQVPTDKRLSFFGLTVGNSNVIAQTSFTKILQAGDIIRSHTSGQAPATADRCIMTIVAEEV
jgi:hypothetical protein